MRRITFTASPSAVGRAPLAWLEISLEYTWKAEDAAAGESGAIRL